MSSKAQKAQAARRALKEARTSGISRTEVYEVADQGDIYDEVDEDEYQTIVDSRRQREDFVVDDDGLGYHDDGEEHAFDGDSDIHGTSKKKRLRTGAHATLAANANALKKARRNNAMLNSHESSFATGTTDNSSMWNFIKRGAAANAATDEGKATGSKASTTAKKGLDDATLDNLLAGLDDQPTSSSSRHRMGSSSRRAGATASSGRQHQQRSSRTGTPSARRSATTPVSRRSGSTSSRRPTATPTLHKAAGGYSYNGAAPESDGDDDDGFAAPMAFDNDDPDPDHDDDTGAPVVEPNTEPADNNNDDDGPVAMDVDGEATTSGDKEDAPASPPVSARRVAFQRPKLQRPVIKKEPAPTPAKTSAKPIGGGAPIMTATTPAATPGGSACATARPDAMATEKDGSGSGSNSSNVHHVNATLETVLQKDVDATDETKQSFVDMFYMDAWEKNGLIYLFGKVAVPAQDKDTSKTISKLTDNNATNFVSCCVVVHNNVRNLFVLPKAPESTTPNDIMDIHKELTCVLKPSCIPLREGESFAAKPVDRQYAFDDATVPRGKTTYLKVKYDAKYPAPAQEVCENGGERFSKIFNGGASPLETFLVKRHLMGPSWLRIYNPSSTPHPGVSWCKVEMKIESPKHVMRLDSLKKEDGSPLLTLATPFVKAVSFKFKTVVNPKTNKSEIVSATAICHSKVHLDTPTDVLSTKHVVQLSLIRPLGPSAGDKSGAFQKFPHDLESEMAKTMPGGQLQKMANERALLNRLLVQVGAWDPDIICGHNVWGYDMDLLLSRCVELRVPSWSKVGRRRVMSLPSKDRFGRSKDWAIAEAMVGRILCDTYLSAKELLRETTYSLKQLASSQLKVHREDVEPVDIPQLFNSSQTIVQLANHTLLDAQLVMKLMLKLQILPLTKQLTCIAGNLWSRTVKGNRAERNEYLLLHEFHSLKYICPEKVRYSGFNNKNKAGGKEGRAAAKYSGGLVFEPKKGLYDSMILLLDFNSLYPSIIQEYNLCFTTVDWANYTADATSGSGSPSKSKKESNEDDGDEVAAVEETNKNQTKELPPLPEENMERGVLPRVIKQLVERRGIVKKMMKQEANPEKKDELDIRQKALKLTANSMYGCLGFSHSRFYAQPIAALITALGRDTLQKTRDIAEDDVKLEVIYGDTDSIMINTGITDLKDYAKVMELGQKVKREVNRRYKTLELEIDGVFKSMLLLKKKKYAAVTIQQAPNGEFIFEKELKGLDLVRRDWCVQSKDTGRYVLDQILSVTGQEVDSVVGNIYTHLEELAKKMRSGALPLDKFTITKGLSKHPNDYPDGKSQPHVQVAKTMLKNNRPVNVGDHIPYVICLPEDEATDSVKPEPGTVPAPAKKKQSPAERARHPEEIMRSNGALKPDIEWYLTQQILPPITRLCEPIAAASQAEIAQKLGLDSSKYNNIKREAGENPYEDDLIDYKPASSLSDEERFKDVEKLSFTCLECGDRNLFEGAVRLMEDGKSVESGLNCPNVSCQGRHLWGHKESSELYAKVTTSIVVAMRRHMRAYYAGVMVCDDSGCQQQTRQLSVLGDVCLKRGCTGKLKPTYSDAMLYTQFKYFDTLFDTEHALVQIIKSDQNKFVTRKEILKEASMPSGDSGGDVQILSVMREVTQTALSLNAYNWVEPSIWQTLFGSSKAGKSMLKTQ